MKGSLKSYAQHGKKSLYKLFSMIVKAILQKMATLGESGTEVSHFIPEPRNFIEVKNCQRIQGNLG